MEALKRANDIRVKRAQLKKAETVLDLARMAERLKLTPEDVASQPGNPSSHTVRAVPGFL